MYTLQLTIKSLQNYNFFIKKKLFKIKKILKKNEMIIKGNIYQKKKKKIFTVLKSPHVNKKSQEHFNFYYYKNTYFIINDNLNNLINFLIIFKKILSKNLLLKVKILKN